MELYYHAKDNKELLSYAFQCANGGCHIVFQKILNNLFVFLSDITYYILGLHMIKQRTKNWFWILVVTGLWLTMALNWCT
jgi:hypothetical protein